MHTYCSDRALAGGPSGYEFDTLSMHALQFRHVLNEKYAPVCYNWL